MKKLAIISTVILAIPAIALAVPEKKYLICKYVGIPGVNETLQTGQNPISVSGNAITPPVIIGAYFNDQQGRSLVVAEDTGQPEPTCPTTQNPTPPPTPPVVPPTPPVVPPTITPNPTPQTTQENETPNFTGYILK